MRSNYRIKNPDRNSNFSEERRIKNPHTDFSVSEQREKSYVSSLLQQEEELMFNHLYRKCQCGSGDVWSECNGIEGDDSYCG